MKRHDAILSLLTLLLLAACAPQTAQSFRATVPPAAATAPVYTPTPTLTPTLTLTVTPSLTPTLSPTPSPTLTITPSPTLTQTPTRTPTLTPSVTPTQRLLTLTPPSTDGAPPPAPYQAAELAATAGWSCGDFPCEDDLDGFLRRIRVPEGYSVFYAGRFPGQPMQITYGPDGRLYATVIDDPAARTGAVYVMNPDGSAERYGGDFVSPVGLAFQPGTDVLYVSARESVTEGGGVWRLLPDGTVQPVISALPCCFSQIDNQPNGLVFGPDGYLYLGLGALTDRAEPANPQRERFATPQPYEASILRIQPHTGDIEVFAEGFRNPYDLTFDAAGRFYATDQGTVEGIGDRLLAVQPGAHHGWPYWRTRGCAECPPLPGSLDVVEDLFRFPAYSIPRGLVAYTGTQFPQNMFGSLFVVLWNGTDEAQRVVRLDPANIPQPAEGGFLARAEPFITGLIRPIDVAVAPDGSLMVADFIYGYVWRVRYTGED